jgi:putative transcriptional regulator
VGELVQITPNRIKEFRTRSDMTQNELAELVMVSKQTIARWESMKADVPLASLRKLALVFDCTASDLVHLNDELSFALKAVDRSRREIWGYSNSEPDEPWGGVHLRLIGVDRKLIFPIDCLSYDILSDTLVELTHEYDTFEAFSTLDNRLLIVHTGSIDELVLVDDNIEAMPSFHEKEVYRLLAEMELETDLEALEELSKQAAAEFSDQQHYDRVFNQITVVTRDGETFLVDASDSLIESFMLALYTDERVFVSLDEPRAGIERFIRIDRVLYASIPLIKYKLIAARYNLDEDPYNY